MKKHTPANAVRFRRKPLISALEPRILLDGAAVATAVEMTTDVAFQEAATHTASAEQSMHFAAPAPTASEPGNRREVAFVDTSVDNYQDLVDGLDDGVEVILIDSSENGLEQMVAALQGQSGIDAIHLFSHGDVGELKLGTLTLNGENLDANAQLLAALGETLTESGDLMLYGCYVGSDSEGQGFLDAVAQLTSADVAASEDLTGAQALGGDWELEVTSGSVETTALVAAGYDGTLAPLVISNLDDLQYSEGDGAVLIDGDVTIGGGTDYTGGYIDFEIGGATSSESLGFISDSTPSTVNGEVTIVGTTVYRGNGSVAIVIGSVDPIKNGENGQPLRINFSNAFENGDFQDGTNGSTVISGWTTDLNQVRLNGIDQIAGQATPIDTTWPVNNGTITDDVVLDRIDSAKRAILDEHASGDLAIRLDTGVVWMPSSDYYGVFRGPSVYSNGAVTLQAGDTVSFDWKALSGGDAYDAFGYIIDVNTGETITILDRTGASAGQTTDWATEDITIASGQEGVYRFVFVAGSYDASGGGKVGGELLIDNVIVTQANPPGPVGDSVLTSLAQRITYENTAVDYNTLTRTVTVSVMDKAGNTGSDTSQVTIAERNNAPSFSGNATLGAVNEDTTAPAGSSVGTLFGSLFSDVDASFDPKDSLAGIIITGDASDSSQGEWQYSTDGTNWIAVGTVSADAGLLLSSTASLRFFPAADYNGTPGSLSVHAVDSSDSGITFTSGASRQAYDTTAVGNTGGTTAVSASAVSLATSITAVDDAPVMDTPASPSINDTDQLDTFGEVNGTLTASDRDTATADLRYGIQGGELLVADVSLEGTYGTLKVIRETGEYTYTPNSAAINALGSATTDSFTVTVSDGTTTVAKTLTFNINGTNDAPVFGTIETVDTTTTPPDLSGGGDPASGVEVFDNGLLKFGNGVQESLNALTGMLEQPFYYEGGSANQLTFAQYALNFSLGVNGDGTNDWNLNGDLNMAPQFTNVTVDTSGFSSGSGTLIWRGDITINGAQLQVTHVYTLPADSAFLQTRTYITNIGSSDATNLRIWVGTQDDFIAGADNPSKQKGNLVGGEFDVITSAEQQAQAIKIYSDDTAVLFFSTSDKANTIIGQHYGWNPSDPAGEDTPSINPQESAYDQGPDDGGYALFVRLEDLAAGESQSFDWYYAAGSSEQIDSIIGEVAAAASANLVEGSAQLIADGEYVVSDVDTGDVVTVTPTSVSAVQRDSAGNPIALGNVPDEATLLSMLNITPETVVDAVSTTGNFDWTFDAGSEGFDFLGQGETLVLSYTLTADDGNGGTAEQTVEIIIEGVNDAPVAQSGTQSVAENGAYSGNVPAATDVDGTITGYQLVSSVASGALIFNSNGSYSFNPGTSFDDLAAGESRQVSFTYRAVDDNGAVSETATITLTVVGSNDAPEIAAVDVAGQITDGSTLTDSGSITFTDSDQSDRPTATESTKSITAKQADGVTDLQLSEAQRAAIENAFSISPAAGNDNDGTINWTYNIDAADLKFLGQDEVVSAVFTITVDDGHGGTDTQDVTVTLTGTNDPVAITGQSSITLDEDTSVLINGFTVTDVDSDNITVRISSSHGNLTLDNPGSVSVSQSGGHTLVFSGAIGDVQAALNSLRYAGDADYFGSDQLTIEASDDSGTSWQPYRVDEQGLFYNPANGHYYEYVSAPGMTWADAKAAAESRELFGLKGYLATVTSAEENAFITPKLGGDGWMGASDAAIEGQWRWVTGPEAGTLFWTGTGSGSSVDGNYENWGDGEPNNAGEEDYAHFISSNGKWNDYAFNNGAISGYIVEYGGAGFGNLEAATLDITINAVNDTPVVTGVDTDGTINDGSTLTDTGSITFTDADPSDRPTASEVTKSVTAKRADGTTNLPLTTEQLAAIENAFSISPAAGNDNDGTINWTYDIDASDLEFLAEGEVVTAVFTITVDDDNGGTATQDVTVTLTGSNDAPKITVVDVTGEIIDGTDLTDSGSITFTDVDLTDRPAASEVTKSVTAKRADGTTNLPLTTEQLAAIENAFSISPAAGNDNDGTINWTYDIDASDLEFLAEGEVVTAVFTITVDDDNGGTATQDVTVTLTGSNDAPKITVVDVTGEIIDGTDLTDSGSITFTDVDLTDRPTASEVTKSVTAKKADGSALSLTTEQQAAIEEAFKLNAADSNVNDGTVNWVYDIKASDLEFLAEGEVVTAVFTITVDDDNGGTATQDVTVTLTGSNDAPKITVVDVTGEIIDGTDLTDSGSITFTDVDLTDRPTASEVTKSVTAKKADGTALSLTTEQQAAIEEAFKLNAADSNVNDGTVNWVYDIKASDLEFLAEGEVVTAVFTITVNDGKGGTDTQDVTVTLTGSNDAPKITVVDVTGEITDGTDLTDSGSITFTDVDLTDRPAASEVTKSVTAKKADGSALSLTTEQQAAIEEAFKLNAADSNVNDGTVNWVYDIKASDLEFLAEGEVVTAVFTITVDDDNGGTATQDVTVTLTGSNDAPKITVVDVTGEIIDGTDLTDSGSITFTDVDLTDRPTASEVTKSVTAKKADGTALSLTTEQQAAIEEAFKLNAADSNVNDGTVNWVYDIKASDLEFLAEGEVVTAVFTITVNDGKGGTDTQDVTVTLTGSNDAPKITVVDVTGEIIDGTDLTDSGSITFTDVDLTDRPTASEVTKSVTAKKADGTALSLTTEQQAAIEEAFKLNAADSNVNDGTVNWVYDIKASDLEFLAEGEVVTAVFTITVNDGKGGTDTQDVTVTLTGSNDAPKITVVDVTGEIIDGTDLTDSGSITFTDVDLTDRPTASEVTKSVTAKKADGTALSLTTEQQAAIEEAFKLNAADSNVNDGTVNWVYDIKASDLEFLAEGEVVTAVFTITVDDDNGGTATQDVTVTLTGSNDEPQVTVDAPEDFTEADDAAAQDLVRSGEVHFADVDLTDTIDVSFESNDDITWSRADDSVVGSLPAGLAQALFDAFSTGATGLDNEGSIGWTYDVRGLDLDFLNAGDQINFSYTVTVEDSQGATDQAVVNFRILGTNDAPEVTASELSREEITVQLGDRYALEVDSLFSDKDSTLSREDLDFSISGLPRGLVYNPETGSISGSPREPGVFEVQVTAIDAEGATVSRVFELTVTAVPNEAPANPGPGSTPPAAPDTDSQPVELPQSGMPDGLVSESGDTRDPLDSSGFMPSSGLGFESVVEDAIGEGSEPFDDLQGADNDGEGRSEQVILSEPGAIAVQVRNPDGSTTVRASIDVNVNEAGQVEFTQVQRDAFDVVSLVVTSIKSNSEGQVVIAIQDTSTNGGTQRYSGTLSSGEQLPGWIQLDPTTGSVTIGNPPAGQKEVSIRVQAIGSDGQIRVLELKLDLEELFKRAAGADAQAVEPVDAESTGFIPLNDQLAAEIAARDHYGSRLVSMLQSV